MPKIPKVMFGMKASDYMQTTDVNSYTKGKKEGDVESSAYYAEL